jgi:ATP-binding cassette, subfamily F, member 3
MSELMKRHADLVSRIEAAEARWIRASEALEAAGAA